MIIAIQSYSSEACSSSSVSRQGPLMPAATDEQKWHHNEHSHMIWEAHEQNNSRNIQSQRNPKDNINNNATCCTTGQLTIN